MSIQDIENLLVESGIERSEAKTEVKMMIEHFCDYSAKRHRTGEYRLFGRY